MKFLIAIVLYRVEKKINSFIKNEFICTRLACFSQLPSCRFSARASARAELGCLRPSRPSAVGRARSPARAGRPPRREARCADVRPGGRALALWATCPWTRMDLCCVDAGAPVVQTSWGTTGRGRLCPGGVHTHATSEPGSLGGPHSRGAPAGARPPRSPAAHVSGCRGRPTAGATGAGVCFSRRFLSGLTALQQHGGFFTSHPGKHGSRHGA